MSSSGRHPIQEESHFSEELEETGDEFNFIENFTFTNDVIYTANGGTLSKEDIWIGTEISPDKQLYGDEVSKCQTVSTGKGKQKANHNGRGKAQKRGSSVVHNQSQGKKPRGRPIGSKDIGKRTVVVS